MVYILNNYDNLIDFSENINIINHNFYSGNFSIVKIPNENNYLITNRLMTINNKNNYISLHRFTKINKNFQVIEKNKIFIPKLIKQVLLENQKVASNKSYFGIEDIRLFNYNGKIIILGSMQLENGQIVVVNGHYEANLKLIININMVKVNFNYQSVEKNWSYYIQNNKLRIIYKWYPLDICEINSNNELVLLERKEMPNLFFNARGSTCGVNYNNEIYFIVHCTTDCNYLHFFVVFDLNMNLKRVSETFKFENQEIEFCIGFEVIENFFVLCYSVSNSSSKVAVYHSSKLNSLNWIFF